MATPTTLTARVDWCDILRRPGTKIGGPAFADPPIRVVHGIDGDPG
jgi:hypothetical protein